MGNVLDRELEAIWNDAPVLALKQGVAQEWLVSLCANRNAVKPSGDLVPKAQTF